MNSLPFTQLEQIYDELAQAIDHAGPERESIFLTKLVLCLAHESGNGERVSTLIQKCLHDESLNGDQPLSSLI